MDTSPPPSPSCPPHRCRGPWPWPKPFKMLPMGSRDAVGFGGVHPPGAGRPPTPLPAPARLSPPIPRATSPTPIPTAPTPAPGCPPLTSHSPRAGGRWVRSCTDPGLTVPVPASAPARLFPASVSERPAWPGLLPTPRPAPRSQNFLGSLQKPPRWWSIPTAACSPMASAHAGWGRVTGDGRAWPGWTPATERRGAGICAGEERLVLCPPSFPAALMTNKCPTNAMPCRAVPCRPRSVASGGAWGLGKGGQVQG